MPRDRLKSLLKFLRFDVSTRSQRNVNDKLAPIRDVFETINASLNEFYKPGLFVTGCEHLARYPGKCSFKQYLPNKPDRHGLKVGYSQMHAHFIRLR